MSKDIYEQMTDRIMLTGSKLIPELFRMIADQSEAELLMAMRVSRRHWLKKPADRRLRWHPPAISFITRAWPLNHLRAARWVIRCAVT